MLLKAARAPLARTPEASCPRKRASREMPGAAPGSRLFASLRPGYRLERIDWSGAASAVGVANPPWPCTAGGRHISKPRLRQGQLPNGRYRPRGISGLTHRAAPLLTTYLGCLDPHRNGFDALRDLVDA